MSQDTVHDGPPRAVPIPHVCHSVRHAVDGTIHRRDHLLANENWLASDYRPYGSRSVGASTDVLAFAPPSSRSWSRRWGASSLTSSSRTWRAVALGRADAESDVNGQR